MVDECCASVNSECTRVGPVHMYVAHVCACEHVCASVVCLLRYLGEHVFVHMHACIVCGGVPVYVYECPVYTRVEKQVSCTCMYTVHV